MGNKYLGVYHIIAAAVGGEWKRERDSSGVHTQHNSRTSRAYNTYVVYV